MLTDEIIQIYKTTGHLEFPFGETNPFPTNPLPTSLDDPAVMMATESYQAMYAPELSPMIAAHYPERAVPMVHVDGKIGPAMLELLNTPRCACPDYTAETFTDRALGSGGWKGCHGVGDFHAVSIRETNNPPAHLAPYWGEVKRRATAALAAVGKQLHFDGRAPINIDLAFVSSSDGWIGLATVGNRSETCASPGPSSRWMRFLSTYGQNYEPERKIRCWGNLFLHELGHVESLQHSTGIMRSYIDENIPSSWIGDPNEGTMKGMYGGVPIPGDEPDPGPGPPPVANLWFKGTVEAMDNQTSRGKYILVPASES